MTDLIEIEPNALFIERRSGNPDAPVLLLLHGLGGTGAVWSGVIDDLQWSGDVLVPDLRGHGASPWTEHYSFGAMAADVAGLIGRGRSVVAVGHSMGGVVALALASGWFGITIDRVMTVGIKVYWTDEEISGIDRIAAKPARTFDDESAAIEWAAKLAGLHGVVEPRDRSLARSTVRVDDVWRAALDPRAGTVGAPPLDRLHDALGTTPVLHTLGDADHMVDETATSSMGRPVEVFRGAGHNAMVERPDLVLDALRRFCS